MKEAFDIWLFAVPASIIYGLLSFIGISISLWLLSGYLGSGKPDIFLGTAISNMLIFSVLGINTIYASWSYILSKENKQRILGRKNYCIFSITVGVLLIFIVNWSTFRTYAFSSFFWIMFYFWNFFLILRLISKFLEIKGLKK